MLSLLLQHPFALADAFITILVLLNPLPLEDLDPETGVHGIVAGEVAVRETPADLMAALIGDTFEIAHDEAVCLYDKSQPVAPSMAVSHATGETCLI